MKNLIRLNCIAKGSEKAKFYFDPEKILLIVDVIEHRNVVLGYNDFYYSVKETVKEIQALIEKAENK